MLGADGLIGDRPGFEVELFGRHSLDATPALAECYEVVIVHRGHWRVSHAVSGEAPLFRIRPTSDQLGPAAR